MMVVMALELNTLAKGLVHMLCLINLGTYSMTIFSLVGVKGMYKLGSGRTNFRDLIT